MKPAVMTSHPTDEKAMNDFIEAHANGDVDMSQDTIEAFYAFGHALYEGGKYENAMHFFRFLTLVDSQNRKHWMGLGAAYQMLKEYERALQCYGFAALQNEKDPKAHFHAAECFFSLNQAENGAEALNSARLVALKQPKKFNDLLTRIAIMLERNKIKK